MPDEVYAHFAQRRARRREHAAWDAAARDAPRPSRGRRELERVLRASCPEGWEDALPDFSGAERAGDARRARAPASRPSRPRSPSSSAARPTSRRRRHDDRGPGTSGRAAPTDHAAARCCPRLGGRTFHFGIREHGMGAILNGMTLTAASAPSAPRSSSSPTTCGPAIRLAASWGCPSSTSSRTTRSGSARTARRTSRSSTSRRCARCPNMRVIRPADATETAEAWRVAMRAHRRARRASSLTRQKLPVLDRTALAPASGVRRGGYVLADSAGDPPDVILIGSGSEVHDLLAARETLSAEGVGARVVSLPDWELFMAQTPATARRCCRPALAARLARGRRDVRLVRARRRTRHGARARSLRRVRAGPGDRARAGDHARGRRGCRARPPTEN